MSDKLIITPPLVKGDTQRMFSVPQLSENEMLDSFYNFVALNSHLEKLHYLEVIHHISDIVNSGYYLEE